MKRIFIIDGNYLANRALGILNMKDRVNHLNTDTEAKQLAVELKRSLVNVCETFSPYVDFMIFTVDDHSWRKDLVPPKPYYINVSGDEDIPTESLIYKDNRKKLKTESETNYDVFNEVYNDFCEEIQSKIHLLKINKLEGDDTIGLISNKIKDRKDLEMLIFANDGDLEMTVRNNVFIMRNIKSGDAPNGEYIITMPMYEKYFEMSAMDQLLSTNLNIDTHKKLFALDIFNPSVPVKRSLNKGIKTATPHKILLKKSICGDKKDNIFPILRWKSSTGTKNFKVTEKMLIAALKLMDMFLTEATCKKLIQDKDLMTVFLEKLKKVTKQPNVITENLKQHLKFNIILNSLTPHFLPKESLELFDAEWKKLDAMLTSDTFERFSIDNLKKSLGNTTQTNAGTSVFAKSLPDLDSIIE